MTIENRTLALCDLGSMVGVWAMGFRLKNVSELLFIKKICSSKRKNILGLLSAE